MRVWRVASRRVGFQLTSFVLTGAAVVAAGTVLASRQIPRGRQAFPSNLKDVEIPTPFTVSKVRGRIYSSRRQPLANAEFELWSGNRGIAMFTAADGSFDLKSRTSPGTYRFVAHQEGFHSSVGTVIVSPDASEDNVIEIELQPGVEADDRTPEQRAADWNAAQLPTCAPGVERDPKHHKYPGALLDMPVTAGLCDVRTPEITLTKKSLYRFMLMGDNQASSFERLNCMLGVIDSPEERERYHCLESDPVLKADWTVWLADQVVARGSSPLEDHGSWSNHDIAKIMGRFDGEAKQRYSIELKFLKDASALNAANPHLVLQRF